MMKRRGNAAAGSPSNNNGTPKPVISALSKTNNNDDDSLYDNKGKRKSSSTGGGLFCCMVICIVICYLVLDGPMNNGQGHDLLQAKSGLVGETTNRLRSGTDNSDNANGGNSDAQYHMVFSTSCSPFQDWQSYMFFHSAYKVKQPGTVTRIASGCTDEQKANLEKVHKEQIKVLSDQFFVHFTPEFSGTGEGTGTFQKTKYFNKPFGVKHYMETVLGYDANVGYGKSPHDNSIIMVVDPDMMLLKPIRHTFEHYPETHWRKTDMPIVKEVSHGHPIAQAYMYGNKWLTSLKDNVTHVVAPDSPVVGMSLQDANDYYPAGPPYLATARDMYQIAIHWVKFLPKIRDVFPEMMAEMHGYSTAAAHLKLPHQLSEKFMISDVGNTKEGWDFLQHVSLEDSCQPPEQARQSMEEWPFVLHYCQRYALGLWFSGKYQIPEELFTCPAPLLRVPPRDVAVKYDWYIYPNGQEMKDYAKKSNGDYLIKQNAFAMCTMIDELNAVATHYKKHHCTDDEANYEKTYVFPKKEGAFEEFMKDDSKPIDLLKANAK